MFSGGRRVPEYCVALLAEGVDRNYKEIDESLPDLVALLAEGVDRNCEILIGIHRSRSRPPRGGRG